MKLGLGVSISGGSFALPPDEGSGTATWSAWTAVAAGIVEVTGTGAATTTAWTASGSGVTYPQIANLKLRLRGDLGITTSSGNVTNWTDQSGTTADFIAAGAARPTLGSGINSKQTVLMNGTANIMTCTTTVTNIIANNAVTAIAVFKYTKGTAEQSASFSNQSILSDTGLFWGVYGCTGKVLLYNWDGTDDSVRPTASDNNGHVAVFQHTGGNLTGQVDANSAATPVASGNTTTLTGTLVIGRNFWGGEIGEILVYNRVLDSTELASIRAYIHDFWGVSVP